METLVPESYLSPQQAFEMQSKGALIIDVREEFEFADKGIDLPQVYNFPLQKLEEQYLQIPKKKPLILVCAIGFSSEKAAKILLKKGLKQLCFNPFSYPAYICNSKTLPRIAFGSFTFRSSA